MPVVVLFLILMQTHKEIEALRAERSMKAGPAATSWTVDTHPQHVADPSH